MTQPMILVWVTMGNRYGLVPAQRRRINATREKYEDFFTDDRKSESTESSEKGIENKGMEKGEDDNVTSV